MSDWNVRERVFICTKITVKHPVIRLGMIDHNHVFMCLYGRCLLSESQFSVCVSVDEAIM